MELEFGYGTSVQRVTVPEKNLLALLTANEMEHIHRGEEAVTFAMAHPIGCGRLGEQVRPGQKIASWLAIFPVWCPVIRSFRQF